MIDGTKKPSEDIRTDGAPDACPLCSQSAAVRMAGKTSAFGEPFPVAFCGTCELYFVLQKPSAELLAGFYANRYFATVRRSRLTYLGKSLLSKMRAFSQYVYITRHIPPDSGRRILEAGSADGTFLALWKKNGWNIRGLEFNEYMIEKARIRHGIMLDRTDILDINPAEGRYDVIAFSHVLEHLADPERVLRHCRALLEPGGVIFIEVPHSPLPEETVPEILADYLDTTHLFNFRPHSLALMVAKAGLETRSLDRSFYAIPAMFRGHEHSIGSALMKGRLTSPNPLDTARAALTAAWLTARLYTDSDPMRIVPLEAPWQGLGDSLRVILIADCRFRIADWEK